MIEFQNNPFEAGHIKNYMLLYGAIIVIIILFFFASNLWLEPKKISKKVFDTNKSVQRTKVAKQKSTQTKQESPKFKLLQEDY